MTHAPRAGGGPTVALRRLGKRLLRSDRFQTIAARCLYGFLVLVFRTNKAVADSQTMDTVTAEHRPVIIALWHGQQMLAPFVRPAHEPVATLVSRSADAEINARVLKLAGCEVVRGSGGRDRAATSRKGGVAALIALRHALRRGTNVVMIADISKGAPRQAGEGIVHLARASGRPIVPAALATSRHHVVEGAWDRMTVNLPFGRRCIRFGAPIYVPGDARGEAIDGFRRSVTDELNRVTGDARRFAEAAK